MNIAIYGGAFDPIHVGHERAIEYLSEHFDKVVVLLAKLSPFKAVVHSSEIERLDMLKSVVKYDNVCIDTQELDRDSPSYTVHSVLNIRNQYKDAQLWLCIGQDNLSRIHKWCEWSTIEDCCSILVFERACYPTSMLDGSLDIDDATHDHILGVVQQIEGEIVRPSTSIKHKIANIKLPCVSSSLARLSIGMGCGHWCLSDTILNIVGVQLYQEYAKLSSSLEMQMFELTSSRIAHIKRATLNGVALAEICGVDKHKVAVAMLLHDIAKCLPLQQLQQLSESKGWDLDIDNVAQLPMPIQHSLAGRYIARAHFGVDDIQVLDAIEYHTTSRSDMTELDMVVYLADATECGRLYEMYGRGLPYANILRVVQLAYSGQLHLAMRYALQDSVDSLIRRNIPIFYLTQQALDWYSK